MDYFNYAEFGCTCYAKYGYFCGKCTKEIDENYYVLAKQAAESIDAMFQLQTVVFDTMERIGQ